ncbi:MAG: DUF4416 family protein [Candidatus Aminicenantes bacterium]|nr:DUF4416 family protein [Candidatus Aminicenantes bacterium]
MAEPKSFKKRKLIIGIMAGEPEVFSMAQEELGNLFGSIDMESNFFPFTYTDYYSKQMGGASLMRKFISFDTLVDPETLSEIKITTNRIEEKIRIDLQSPHRIVNIDPGVINDSSLIMATVKDFAHRIPLQKGIYGHLELLFGKNEVRILDWTYPDFRKETYHSFFLDARKKYLDQIKYQ